MRRTRYSSRVVAVCLAATALTGCSTGGGRPVATSGPVTATAAPGRTSTYASHHPVRITLQNPDGIVAAAGAVWVKTDDGRVVRIDPATNKVTRKIKVDTASDPSRFCQGIAVVGDSVWACAATDHGTDVVEIATSNGRIVRRVAADKTFDQIGLPATSRGIWVLTGDGSEVGVVDPTDGRITRYPVGARSQQLAADDERVVATSVAASTVVALDARSGRVVGRTKLVDAGMPAVAGGSIWVDARAGLTRLSRNAAVRTVYRGVSADADLVAASGSLWARTTDGVITRIDPASGRVLERISPERPLTPGSLLVAYGSLWTTSGDGATVVRLRLEA